MAQDRAQFDHLLGSVLAQLSFKLDSGQASILYKHYELLVQWNSRMNLTAIRDPEKVVFRHFGESLAVAKLIGPGVGPVVDIGSGAGFPGVPVAVCWPDREVTLVESTAKKAIFLKEIARQQANLRVFEGRFEEFQGNAEWVTMRGVASSGIEAQIGRVAHRVAWIVSAAKAVESADGLGVGEVVEHPVPWDRRTVILSGEIGTIPGST